MKTSRPLRALLIQLEFPTWETARPWTYSANFAIQEGLRANGVECVTVPVIARTTCGSSDSWVYHAKKVLAGERFDQVWLWLVHTPLDEATLEWVAGLAPVRVGILMESLRYEAEDYAWAPQLKLRQGQLDAQLPYPHTSSLPMSRMRLSECARPCQSTLVATDGAGTFHHHFAHTPSRQHAVFHGTPYGRRQDWVNHVALEE